MSANPAFCGGPLSWEDCVRIATENNPALLAALKNERSSLEQVGENRSGYFPQLSGALGYVYANTATVAPGGSSAVIGGSSAASSYTATVTASQNIFNGLSDQARVDQAVAGAGTARANLQAVKAQLSYNLKAAFVGLVIADKSVALARRIIGRREQNLRMVELRFKDGQENKGNVLLYQAYLKDARFGELQSLDNIISSQAQLAQALGWDDYTSLSVHGDVPINAPPSDPNAEKLAIESPSFVQAVFQLKSDDASVVLARSAFFPTLGVSASAGRSGSWGPNTGFGFGSSPLSSDHWQLGATFSVPLFSGGHDFFATRAAIETREAADQTRHDTAHSVASTLANDYTNYIESIQRLEVDRAYLEAAQVRAAIARADYGNGIMSFQDWDLVETDLITREKNILQDQQTRVTAEATWEQAQGKGAIP